jgi:hypothetical protein
MVLIVKQMPDVTRVKPPKQHAGFPETSGMRCRTDLVLYRCQLQRDNMPARFRRLAAHRGWQLLALAGATLIPAGIIFVLRFWDPTSGPYRANVRYPYGSHLNAWAVSFGFAWIAFGTLFAAVAWYARHAPSRRIWWVLLTAWLVCWFPHAFIGAAVALYGMDNRSLSDYQAWAAQPRGALVLALDALLLVVHGIAGVLGFFLTFRQDTTRPHAGSAHELAPQANAIRPRPTTSL